MTTEKRLSEEELQALEAKTKVAHQGAWRCGPEWEHPSSGYYVAHPTGFICGDGVEFVPTKEDAAYIAAANPQTVAALLAEVREHRALTARFDDTEAIRCAAGYGLDPHAPVTVKAVERVFENVIRWIRTGRMGR